MCPLSRHLRHIRVQSHIDIIFLQIYYKVCQARVLDYKRKFIEAASRYNELSYKPIIHEDERMTALKNAMICTILAAAGHSIYFPLWALSNILIHETDNRQRILNCYLDCKGYFRHGQIKKNCSLILSV